MAFEDFEISEQVISATDYDTIKIKEGEGANTENFNRSVVDSINRDAMLEAALTYMARSSSLFTTANTKFLSHCEGQGIDVVSAVAPVLTTSAADIFLEDSNFLGAAWPQRAATNMMSFGTSDSSLKTTSGWSVNNDPNIGAVVISTTEDYTNISTKNKTDDIVPGDVIFTSAEIPLTDTGSATLNKISGGFTLQTNDNMMSTSTEVQWTFNLLSDDGTTVGTHSTSVIRGSYDGVVGIENIDIPQGATKFQVVIRIMFKAANSRAEFTIKNVMVQSGGILAPYTATTRQQCTCQYNDVINPDNGNITVMCWSIFKEYSMSTHAGPIGPVFISMPQLKVGGVHRAQAGTNMVFSLYVNDLSTSTVSYGTEFTVPQEYLGQYLLSALRIRPSEEAPGKSIVEFAMCAGPNIYKSQLTVNTTLVDDADIILGTDQVSTDFFNGPVTEVRYDTEWVNDVELYIISLAKKAFSFKTSNDLGAADAGETVLDTLDKVGVNLLLNPSGRLAYVGWNNYPETNFTTVHNDVYAGNCFVWVGANAPAASIDSDEVAVKPSNLYTLRAVMYSAENSTGEAGVGVSWLDSDGEEISSSQINITHINQPRYYSLSVVAPADAVSAKVYMYTLENLSTTRLTWSRIKFEMGDATQYTDDSGAGYALYY